jgi:DNA-binding transcriptional ArsR family regulator
MPASPPSIFNALAHDTRLRCVVLLLEHGELCVCELTHALGVSQPHVSRHLAQLRRAGVVSARRDGLWIHYQLHPDLEPWAHDMLRATCQGLRENPPFCADRSAIGAVEVRRPLCA